MTDTEDVVRRALVDVVGEQHVPGDGAHRATVAGRRRTQRRRIGVAAAAAVVLGTLTAVGVTMRRDDRSGIVATTPETETATTSPPEPVFTVGPNQFVVTDERRMAVVDAATGTEVAQLATAHDVYYVDVGPDGSLWYSLWATGTDHASIWHIAGVDRPVREVEVGTAPAISADGMFLAYVAALDTIVVRDLDSGDERRWTGLPHQDPILPPMLSDLAWHPDGTRLAFAYKWGFEYEEHTVAILDLANDGALTDAFELPGWLASPQWTPQGALLAVEPFAEGAGRDPLVRFDDVTQPPVRDARLAGLAVRRIALDPTGTRLLATAGSDVYVVDEPGSPRIVYQSAVGATW